VLDPFAGSGTIPLACARLGRPWLAVEVNPAYCKLMRRRLRLYGVPT
jgi:DNA modification methylase